MESAEKFPNLPSLTFQSFLRSMQPIGEKADKGGRVIGDPELLFEQLQCQFMTFNQSKEMVGVSKKVFLPFHFLLCHVCFGWRLHLLFSGALCHTWRFRFSFRKNKTLNFVTTNYYSDNYEQQHGVWLQMNAKIVAQEKSLVYSAQWKLLLVYSSLLTAFCSV